MDDDTDKVCRILDVERDNLNKIIDGDGNTALLLAVEYASPLMVRLLLAQGAQPDQANLVTNQTPLGLIASKKFDDYNVYKAQKFLEMAKALIECGAYVDKPSPHCYRDENNQNYMAKETPLMTAVRKKNLPLVQLLIEKKANVSYVERQSQIQQTHYAIANGDEAMFDALDNAAAWDPSIMSAGNESLIHWFCYTKENDQHLSILKKLIAKGCDVNAENWPRRTPIFLAVKNDMFNTCQLLLKSGANAEKRDGNGYQVIDFVEEGSECSKLFHRVWRKNSESRLVETSPIDSGRIVFRTTRIDLRRRYTLELNREPKSFDTAGQNDVEKSNSTTASPYIYPDRRRDSDEMDTKYERVWDKLLQKRHQRRPKRDLSQERAYSEDRDLSGPL